MIFSRQAILDYVKFTLGKCKNIVFSSGEKTSEECCFLYETNLFALWVYRLVPGNFVDWFPLSFCGRNYYDGENLSSHVSHLRMRLPHRACFPKNICASCFSPGLSVYRRHFCCRIFQRLSFKAFSHVSLGLYGYALSL